LVFAFAENNEWFGFYLFVNKFVL